MSRVKQAARSLKPLGFGSRSIVRHSVVYTVLIAAAGCWGACDAVPPEATEGTQALSEDVHLIDAPGTPAIVLTWKMARDGAKPVGNLQFEVQNTTGQAVEVELHASTRASGDAVERSVGRLSVSAHSRIDQAFAVDQLGLQTIGSATSTLIVATYKGPDGLTA